MSGTWQHKEQIKNDFIWAVAVIVIYKDVTSDFCSLALVIYTAIAYPICCE